MKYVDELKIAVENLADTVINSPRLAASVGGATTALGAGMRFDWIEGALANLAVAAGIVMTLLLARLHLATVRNRGVEYKILVRQLEAMGAEPATEKAS